MGVLGPDNAVSSCAITSGRGFARQVSHGSGARAPATKWPRSTDLNTCSFDPAWATATTWWPAAIRLRTSCAPIAAECRGNDNLHGSSWLALVTDRDEVAPAPVTHNAQPSIPNDVVVSAR